MKNVIANQVVLLRVPEGPLVPYLDRFANAASTKGYAVKTIRHRVLLATGFSQWLKQQGIELCSITSDHPKQYLQYRYCQLRPSKGDRAALRHLIEFLRFEGVIPAEKTAVREVTEAELCVQTYEEYLREMRALATATIAHYVPFIHSFLEHCFGNGSVTLSRLCASDVVEFVQHQVSQPNRKQAKTMTNALRSFLNYVHYHSEAALDLVAAVPVVANWSNTLIPRAISTDQVHQLLTSISRDTSTGRRDYAILLLLARLGLRASEVAFLDLDDIDWNTGTLHVRTKGGVRRKFPLSHEVGEAIADYLRRSRPMSNTRRVFLRAKAPIQGFRNHCAVSHVVRRSLEHAGVNAPSFGAHQFRHGLATEMLCQGASLNEIGDVLGHRRLQTTKIYAKVNFEALRTLALPWPRGVR